MDSLLTAAARALAQGDALGALKRVALRDDPPALSLRGIAMAQMGDFVLAKSLLRRAARAFGAKEAASRARCVVAEAEIALASRDLAWPTKSLDAARRVLESYGDAANAAHARQLEIRRLVLIGRLDDAEGLFDAMKGTPLSLALRAVHELLAFGIALRRLRIKQARAAVGRAQMVARAAGIPALIAETDNAAELLNRPSVRLMTRGEFRSVLMDEVEDLFVGNTLVVDALRNCLQEGRITVSLVRRPVLFALIRSLSESWPNDVSRASLIARVFRVKRGDESHRARLRVEIGRLRAAIKSVAAVTATREGFVLAPHASKVVVLARPVEDTNADVLALLADGESWSSSGLAIALGASQRSVQRALDALLSENKVQFLGKARARRWILPPLPGFATALLLPSHLPSH